MVPLCAGALFDGPGSDDRGETGQDCYVGDGWFGAEDGGVGGEMGVERS